METTANGDDLPALIEQILSIGKRYSRRPAERYIDRTSLELAVVELNTDRLSLIWLLYMESPSNSTWIAACQLGRSVTEDYVTLTYIIDGRVDTKARYWEDPLERFLDFIYIVFSDDIRRKGQSRKDGQDPLKTEQFLRAESRYALSGRGFVERSKKNPDQPTLQHSWSRIGFEKLVDILEEQQIELVVPGAELKEMYIEGSRVTHLHQMTLVDYVFTSRKDLRSSRDQLSFDFTVLSALCLATLLIRYCKSRPAACSPDLIRLSEIVTKLRTYYVARIR